MQRTILFILTTFIFSQVYTQNILEGKRVLWVGTSIPTHCSYPFNACQNLAMLCMNHSIGASFLSIRPFSLEEEVQTYTGYSLSMTSDEKEELYQPWLQYGRINRHQLDVWKFTSYDNRIIPHLDSIDVVVIDHGFNDSNHTLQAEFKRGKDSVDWSSEDRTTFIGAFNYLYKRIKEAKPEVIIAIGGYFQNNCSVMPRGRYVSEVFSWIAEHYDLPLLDVWNYTDIPDEFIPNSSDYIDNLNNTYYKDFKPQWTDSLGNITYYQMFCPDGIHPWSDPTGHSDHVLDSIFTAILPSRLTPYFDEPHLMFNEVMSNNIESLLYNHRFPISWFELHNPTAKSINLHNWRVSTRNDYATAYNFDHIKQVPAEAHTLICCDGRDDHWEHTNFILNPDAGGALYLWDPEGNLVDSLRYPAALGPDISYGRISDGTPHWQFKHVATPNETNITGGSTMILPAPLITVLDGKFFISTDASDVPADTYIYFTTDGSTPSYTSEHIVLDSTIVISSNGTTVLKARLMSPHAHPSPVITRSLIQHPRQTSLPIISLSTDNTYLYSEEEGILLGSDWNGNCYKHWERPLYLEYFESADDEKPLISQYVQADTHGVGSLIYSQKSLELSALKRYGCDSFDTSSFWPSKPQVQKSRSFLLRNGGDRVLDTRFEDAFVQELFGQHLNDIEYQAYRPVIVYINGAFKGIYELRESDSEAWVESNLGIHFEDITLLKSFTSNDNSYQPIVELLANEEATLDDYAKLIDIPRFLNYLCAEFYATNNDYPHNNVTLWRNEQDEEPRFHALLRNLDYMSTTSYQTNWLNYLTCVGEDAVSVRVPEAHQLFIRLFNLKEFRDAFIDRMTVYLGDFLKPSVTIPMVNKMRDEIADEIAPTFALMREQPDYERDFIGNIENRLIPYCQNRPLLLYSNMYSTFKLKGVYLLTAEGADSINGIRPTQDIFEGCCFYNHPFTLTADSL